MEERGERPAKRPRLAEGAHAAIEDRKADKETALEVDIMMMDYIAYQATNAGLASRDPTTSSPLSLRQNLALTDSFLAIFQVRHPEYKLDAELRFRLRLLKLVTLFSQRLTRNPTTPLRSALKQVRASNQDRARTWISSAERLPTANHDISAFDDSSSFPRREELERNRAHVLHELGIPAEDEAYEDAHYGTSEYISLLDLLPQFMQISAARNAMSNSNLSEQWMRMAGEFMLQACLEQYLVVGANGSDAVDEAFAWGYKAREQDGDSMEIDGKGGETPEDEVNEMLEDEIYETEVDGWTAVKQHYLELLFPPSAAKSSKDTYSVSSSDEDAAADRRATAADIVSRLEMTAAQHPIDTFEKTILSYLAGMSLSIPKPVLVQLEDGELDGMSKEETAAFVRSCGTSIGRFYEPPAGFKSFLAE